MSRDAYRIMPAACVAALAGFAALAILAAPAPRRAANEINPASSIALANHLLAAPRPANAPSVFVPDKGKLRITIGGQQVGSEEFSMSPSGDDWVERSTMSAHAAGGAEIKATGQLRLAADGSPLRYEWSAEAQKKASGSVEFSGMTAKCVGDFADAKPLRKDFTFNSGHIAVLDNNLYYQYAVLARQYDWKAGGKQNFSVLIPQDMVPGTVSVEVGVGAASEALRVSTPDLEIMLYLDSAQRLIRLEVPSSNAVIERE
jgi:hypothetical protein